MIKKRRRNKSCREHPRQGLEEKKEKRIWREEKEKKISQ